MKNIFGICVLAMAFILSGCGESETDTSPSTQGNNTPPAAGGSTTGGSSDSNNNQTGGSSDTSGGSSDVSGGSSDMEETGTIYEVNTEIGNMKFLPEALTIAVGDTVRFIMTVDHNAVEVSQETYENRGFAPLEGGFNVSFGETQEITFDEPGVYYYICQPHVSLDMIGVIAVESPLD